MKRSVKSDYFLNRPEFLVQHLSFLNQQTNHLVNQKGQRETKANEYLRNLWLSRVLLGKKFFNHQFEIFNEEWPVFHAIWPVFRNSMAVPRTQCSGKNPDQSAVASKRARSPLYETHSVTGWPFALRADKKTTPNVEFPAGQIGVGTAIRWGIFNLFGGKLNLAVCENRICPGEIEFPPPPISQVFGVTVAHVHVHPSRTFCRKLTRESRVSPRHLGETRTPSYFPQLEKCEQIFNLPNKTGKQTLCPGEILFCPLQIQKFKQFPHIQFCISFFGYEESRNGNCMENRKAKNEIIS